ncbi:hypothetical protein AAHH67_17715 [Niallia circulans]
MEKAIGEDVSEAYLSHDPWELLEQLQIRFDTIKKINVSLVESLN